MKKQGDKEESLDVREWKVLRRLQFIAEGGTLDLDRPLLKRTHPGSSVPPGVDKGSLSPDTSLYEYHHALLAAKRSASDSVRRAAISAAELDLNTTLNRGPAYISPDSDQNKKDRDDAILRREGERPEEVAVLESCSSSYVRKIRKANNRDQTWGGSLEGFEITA